MNLTICSYHVTYEFQSESGLSRCLNVMDQHVRNRCDIWRFSHRNEIRTHNHLVWKQTLHHVTKLTKWLNSVDGIYLNDKFDCIFLSYQVLVSEWIYICSYLNVKELLGQNMHHILRLSECKRMGTHKHLVCKQILNHLNKLTKWLNCLWVLIRLFHFTDTWFIISHKSFRNNLHSIVLRLWRNSLLQRARSLKLNSLQ